ncbi:MAG: hypothetical protein Sylvanvirus2_34 [Sylvanvirus sp.]|uniref:Uncharacterized protein n=1 Tax=Sylvanvirus sp. TaxID=2487774 RepID=A0A3G5AHC5_9VIRU|nr:MAG: hypothetical protein Sylvanvirus2_34 [Sylvanvirus sp.]
MSIPSSICSSDILLNTSKLTKINTSSKGGNIPQDPKDKHEAQDESTIKIELKNRILNALCNEVDVLQSQMSQTYIKWMESAQLNAPPHGRNEEHNTTSYKDIYMSLSTQKQFIYCELRHMMVWMK